MENKKRIVIGLSVMIVLMVFIGSMLFLHDFNKKRKETSLEKLYGTVLSYNNGLLEIKTLDNDEVTVISNAEFDKGDFVVVEYYTVGKDMLTTIELVAENEELKTMTTSKVEEVTTSSVVKPTTTTSKTTTTKKTTTKKTTTKKANVTTTTTSKVYKDKDSMIIDLMSYEVNEVGTYDNKETLKDKAKNKVITFLDFIFYDGEIKGVKFSELKESTKAKVIYYTLLLDGKVNDIFPNYKEKISDKYNSFKSKLIAKYFDISTNICSKNERQCDAIKDDFNLLKKSVSITWDFIKSAFIYGADKSTAALKNWYEIWSGKA